MTHDERISSYIDNELSPEMEQEFLISLAASDGLRKSFRSELVLKNMLHRDEAVPPRHLRSAVFAAVGLAGASLVASNANAAMQSAVAQAPAHVSSGLMKSLFASKVNALVTAATISVSGLAGYGVHTLVTPAQNAPSSIVRDAASPGVAPSTSNQVTPQVQTSGVSQDAQQSHAATASGTVHQRAVSASHKAPARVNASGSLKTDAEPVNGTSGGGSISVDQPEVKSK